MHWKTGWRFGVARGALAAFIVFSINLGALLWANLRLPETTDGSQLRCTKGTASGFSLLTQAFIWPSIF
jgi:hypothetical protein